MHMCIWCFRKSTIQDCFKSTYTYMFTKKRMHVIEIHDDGKCYRREKGKGDESFISIFNKLQQASFLENLCGVFGINF
ncbi:hypothetical protein Hanom_Chr17g01556671 [Helianthus anomalus]